MTTTYRVNIHDITTGRVYIALQPEDCIDAIDRDAFLMAIRHQKTIVIGKTIAEIVEAPVKTY